ncbi:lysophospholipid acyltransferase family protein [soil metagenome]
MTSFAAMLVTNGLRALGLLSRMRNDRGRTRLGRTIGGVMMRLDERRRAITASNVAHAFPESMPSERDAIVRGSYHNLGITLAELLAFPSMSAEHLKSRLQIPGIEAIRERAERGLPNVLISGHYGNWELLAMAGALHLHTSFVIVAHPLKNQLADVLLNSYRTRFGNRIVPMHNAARELVRVLKEGGTVAFLADQHADGMRDPWVNFFGRTTPTYEAPAALALKYNAAMWCAFAHRQDDGTYQAPLVAVPMTDLTNTRDDVRELTRRHVALLESAIREHPTMWSWQHRRWRDES